MLPLEVRMCLHGQCLVKTRAVQPQPCPMAAPLPRLHPPRPLTRVDDLAARVQVVQGNQQLAGEVAHRRQRDAAVLVQPAKGHARTACWADGARITGAQAGVTKGGCACVDIRRHTPAWYGQRVRSRRHARVRPTFPRLAAQQVPSAAALT